MQNPSENPPQTLTRSVTYITIDAEREGQRIDNYLISQLKGIPKSRIYRLLRKGEVRVNKGRVKADYKLTTGDEVRIPPVKVGAKKPTAIAGDRLRKVLTDSILFEDDRVIAINKPSGIAVHGGSGIDLGVIEVLRQQYDSKHLELVHRLDRETSGCLLVAKKRSALRQLQNQFRERETRKNYLTLVVGFWPARVHTVTLPLRKNQLAGGERIVKVSPDGKPAKTQFKVIKRYESATLLEVGLVTGRTHQIRVHTQSQHHPIAGDDKYGDAAANKAFKSQGLHHLFLHAYQLHFYLPLEGGEKGKRISLEAPIPNDLQAVLDTLKPLDDSV